MEHILTKECNDEVRYSTYSRQVLSEIHQKPPDIIVMDYYIADANSFEIYRELKKRTVLQNVPVLFQGASAVPQKIYLRVQKLGAQGCLMVPWGPKELLEARDILLKGGTYYPKYDSQ